MSIKQYLGGIITKNPTAPTTAAAKGIWTLDQASNFVKQGLFPRSPGAPIIGTATQTSATTATVTYTVPSDLGTGSVTYTATSSPGGLTGTGASPIAFTGLTTNTAYTFTVRAATPGGSGPASAASNSVTPVATVSGAPTIGNAARAGATSATVAFTAPANNGGSTITSYTATSSPGSITGTLSQAGSGTITVSGLTTGTAYTFTVTATNAIGTSAASAASNSATPATVPGVPTIGTATSTGSSTATVAFTQPASNGGSVITSYTATSSPSGITGTLSQAGSGTITVSGLAASTAYTFTVTATNVVGTGTASAASNSVTTLPAIGAAYAGGYFGGQISTGATGIANYNLVVAPASASGLTTYLLSYSSSAPLTPSEIDGPGNSVTLASTGSAAPFCNNLVLGGFSDWYLPAMKELNAVYYNLKPGTGNNAVSGSSNLYAVPSRPNNNTYASSAGNPGQTTVTAFRTGGAEAFSEQNYWASTSANASYGRSMDFYSGGGQETNQIRYGNKVVRAFRRVAV